MTEILAINCNQIQESLSLKCRCKRINNYCLLIWKMSASFLLSKPSKPLHFFCEELLLALGRESIPTTFFPDDCLRRCHSVTSSQAILHVGNQMWSCLHSRKSQGLLSFGFRITIVLTNGMKIEVQFSYNTTILWISSWTLQLCPVIKAWANIHWELNALSPGKLFFCFVLFFLPITIDYCHMLLIYIYWVNCLNKIRKY